MNHCKQIFFLLSLAFIGSAIANPSHRPNHQPPPEAIEACVNMQEGDSVSFETPRGDILEATCVAMEEELVAVPKNHKKHFEGNPPAQDEQ